MQEINRDVAEALYAKWIMKEGNPEYFIYNYLRNVDDENLEEMLQSKYGHEFTIKEEE